MEKIKKLDFNEKRYLKRLSESNRWTEVNKEDIRNIKYGHPYPKASGLFLGIFTSNGTTKTG